MTRSHHPALRRLATATLLLFAGGANAALDADLLAGLEARNVGPAAVGGRIAAIDAVASDPNRMIVGVATGGVWITDNGGLTWTPVFDDEAVASIGALAINQSNPDIVWVGTGESNVRNSTSIGGGVYKSLDGGQTWKYVGLRDSERIDRITLHPDDPDTAYVAALGTLWGPNEERGVYRTTDGGASWERILYVDENTGATDVKMDPANPLKLYAGMWQFRRWPYQFESGGPGSGIYVSDDGGDTWERRTEEDGLPKGELGRSVFAISPAAPKRVYALVEAKKSALVVSADGGDTWTKVNEEYNVADRPFYYSELAVDPENPFRVYNIATRVRVSIDGGKTFEYIPAIDCCAPGNTIHIDNHAFWINPADPRHIVDGNDGGIAVSRDRGETWRFVRNLPLAQFYHVAVDDADPYNIYGGLQDNGSWRGPAEIRRGAGIQNLDWVEVGFGDGFDTVPYPDDPRGGYAMSQGGNLFRWHLDTGEQRLIRPNPPTPDTDLRFNWNAGLGQDPFDADTIYYGSQFVHKSTNRGESWTVISPDLTSNDPALLEKMRQSGGLTPDVTAAEFYTTITVVAPSPLAEGLLWVGTDDGRVHVTRNGGGSWERVDTRARGVPAGSWVPMIFPSPHDAGTAFVVFDDHRRSNMETYVYRVTDYGRRWQSLATDALSGYALSVLQDHVDPELLFLGTEFGLWVSNDGGDSWSKFTAGVPTVSVMDMAIQKRENDLVLGTHGRSIYVIDDYSALRDLDEDTFSERLKLLSAAPGQQYEGNMTISSRFTGNGEYRGDNEPYGVMLTFVASGDDLAHPDDDAERERQIRRREAGATDDGEANADEKEDEPVKVSVTVANASGETIRRFRSSVHQGLNRLTWDLRRDGIRDMPGDEEPDYSDGLPAGPEVPPGRYRVTLSLPDGDGEVQAATDVDVVGDPRLPYAQADVEQNYRARLELQDMRETAVAAVETVVRARDDVNAVKARIKRRDDADGDAMKALAERADELVKTLTDLEKRFRVPPQTTGIVFDDDKVTSKIGRAQGFVGSSLAAPSPAARMFMQIARESLNDAVATVNATVTGDLAAFRRDVDAAGIGLLRDAGAVAGAE